MTATPRHRLYIRLGCHLCDAAAHELAAAGIAFVRVDIDRDAALCEEYGALVPVCHDTHNDREFVYPFTAADILAATTPRRTT